MSLNLLSISQHFLVVGQIGFLSSAHSSQFILSQVPLWLSKRTTLQNVTKIQRGHSNMCQIYVAFCIQTFSKTEILLINFLTNIVDCFQWKVSEQHKWDENATNSEIEIISSSTILICLFDTSGISLNWLICIQICEQKPIEKGYRSAF